eukprot:38743-Eustigmatos_ZCMA.PRE.1
MARVDNRDPGVRAGGEPLARRARYCKHEGAVRQALSSRELISCGMNLRRYSGSKSSCPVNEARVVL